MWVFPDLSVKALLLAVEAIATWFPAGMKLHLYVNNVTPTRTSVLTDFTELTNVEVPGYAAGLPTWGGAPSRKQDGSWEDQGVSPIAFTATGVPPAPQVVYGWFLTDGASAVLAAAGLFDVPFTFVQSGDGFRLEPVLNVIQTAGDTYQIVPDFEQEN